MTNSKQKTPWAETEAESPLGDGDLACIDKLQELEHEKSAATAVNSVDALASAALAEDVRRAESAGVSIATTLIAPLPLRLQASLEFEGTAKSKRISKSVTFIGRTEGVADVVFPGDNAVSRQHAAIIYAEDEFWIEDLASSNGTFVNDKPVKCQKLQSGDRIRCGASTMRLIVA